MRRSLGPTAADLAAHQQYVNSQRHTRGDMRRASAAAVPRMVGKPDRVPVPSAIRTRDPFENPTLGCTSYLSLDKGRILLRGSIPPLRVATGR